MESRKLSVKYKKIKRYQINRKNSYLRTHKTSFQLLRNKQTVLISIRMHCRNIIGLLFATFLESWKIPCLSKLTQCKNSKKFFSDCPLCQSLSFLEQLFDRLCLCSLSWRLSSYRIIFIIQAWAYSIKVLMVLGILIGFFYSSKNVRSVKFKYKFVARHFNRREVSFFKWVWFIDFEQIAACTWTDWPKREREI